WFCLLLCLSLLSVIYWLLALLLCCFFFSSRRRHTRSTRDWSSDVCSSDLPVGGGRSAGRLVPAAAAEIWNLLPVDQCHCHNANRHDRSQPRQCQTARRSVRLWRRLEFLHEGARRSCTAIPAP